MKKILVISPHNSCRSQMAEGWLRYYGSGVAEVTSAGPDPRPLDMKAAQSMMDVVIDITRHQPKSLDSVIDTEFDYVLYLDKTLEHTLPDFKGNPPVFCHNFRHPGNSNLPDTEERKQYDLLRDELENMAFDFVHKHLKPLY